MKHIQFNFFALLYCVFSVSLIFYIRTHTLNIYNIQMLTLVLPPFFNGGIVAKLNIFDSGMLNRVLTPFVNGELLDELNTNSTNSDVSDICYGPVSCIEKLCKYDQVSRFPPVIFISEKHPQICDINNIDYTNFAVEADISKVIYMKFRDFMLTYEILTYIYITLLLMLWISYNFRILNNFGSPWKILYNKVFIPHFNKFLILSYILLIAITVCIIGSILELRFLIETLYDITGDTRPVVFIDNVNSIEKFSIVIIVILTVMTGFIFKFISELFINEQSQYNQPLLI